MARDIWTIQVQVADGIMITALEHLPPGLTIRDPRALADGNTVEVIGRDAAKAAALASALGGGATTGTTGSAPADDIVILAVAYASTRFSSRPPACLAELCSRRKLSAGRRPDR